MKVKQSTKEVMWVIPIIICFLVSVYFFSLGSSFFALFMTFWFTMFFTNVILEEIFHVKNIDLRIILLFFCVLMIVLSYLGAYRNHQGRLFDYSNGRVSHFQYINQDTRSNVPVESRHMTGHHSKGEEIRLSEDHRQDQSSVSPTPDIADSSMSKKNIDITDFQSASSGEVDASLKKIDAHFSNNEHDSNTPNLTHNSKSDINYGDSSKSVYIDHSHYVNGYTRSNGTYVAGHMSDDPGEGVYGHWHYNVTVT